MSRLRRWFMRALFVGLTAGAVLIAGAIPGRGVASPLMATPPSLGSAASYMAVGSGVLAWGSNGYGELGDTSTTERHVPIDVSGLGGLGVLGGVVAVSAGGEHSLALRSDGTVLAWGRNGDGRLGDNSTLDSHVPVPVSGLAVGSGVITVSAGRYHSLALRSDGTVLAWGGNAYGQLGIGSTTESHVPVQVSGLGVGSGVVAVSAGNVHSLALKSNGTVLAWGNNGWGYLGTNNTIDSLVPIQVSGLGTGSGVVAVSAGSSHSLALKQDGTVLAWGYGGYGQLGNNSATFSLVPVQTSGLGIGSGVVAVSAGSQHSLALKLDGTVLAWGWNGAGQLGNNSTINSLVPVQVSGLGGQGVLSGLVAVSAGSSHNLALKLDGTVLAWGANASGKLGDNSATERDVPVQVSGLGVGSGVVAVSAGTNHSLALGAVSADDPTATSTATATTTSTATSTATGTSTPTVTATATATSTPTAAATETPTSTATATATPAATATGTATATPTATETLCPTGAGSGVLAWGYNYWGRLGDNSTTESHVPVAVSGLGVGSGVIAVSAGGNHSLALKSDGTVLAWGYNYWGELGNNSTTESLVPVPVNGLGVGSGVVAVSAGAYHSLALKSDGTVLGAERGRPARDKQHHGEPRARGGERAGSRERGYCRLGGR